MTDCENKVSEAKAAAWEEGYRAGNLDGYFGTRDEKNPYSSDRTWDRVHNRPADIYTPPEDRVPAPDQQVRAKEKP